LDVKILIADDDQGMRLVLKKVIEKNSGFEIIGEAEDGITALNLADSSKPDIIFMDIEMPELNGIECAKRILDINPKTIIIFATAHEEYMQDAFEVYAFDYLVKPFKIERINQTLKRIKDISNQKHIEPIPATSAYPHDKGLEKLIIRNKEGISFIDMNEIILIQREDRSTVIYTSAEHYSTSEGLSEIEGRLSQTIFFRCHKSYIINLTMVSKIYPYGRWTYLIKLRNTEKDALITSDRYEVLQNFFGA
jgi:two-component system, LytTR family, response regulator